MCGLLTAVVNLVAEHGLRGTQASEIVAHSLEHEGSVTVLHRLSFPAACNCPRPGIEPMSPALAGRFLNTRLPGSPIYLQFFS